MLRGMLQTAGTDVAFMQALGLQHPAWLVRDTARFPPLMKVGDQVMQLQVDL